MNHVEFEERCLPLNKKYYELFKYFPRPTDYVASREEYLNALQIAVDNEKELSTILEKIVELGNEDSLY